MKQITNDNGSYQDTWNHILWALFLYIFIFFICLFKTNKIIQSISIACIPAILYLLIFLIGRRVFCISIDNDKIDFIEKSTVLGMNTISFPLEYIDIEVIKVNTRNSSTKKAIIVRYKVNKRRVYKLVLKDDGWDKNVVILFFQQNDLIKF